MPVYSPTTDRADTAQLRAELDQLRRPIRRPAIRQRVRTASGRRVTQWTEPAPLPPLLDQLRAATAGSGSTVRGPERRQRPRSRPPGHLDAMDLLSRIYVALSGWHVGLNLPIVPRWRHGCAHGSCQAAMLAEPEQGPVCPRASLTPVDWQRYALGQLHDLAAHLEPATVRAIGEDVHQWWRWTATVAGLGQDELRAWRG